MSAKNKLMIKVVAIVLIACAGVVLLGNVTGGFQNMKPSEWKLRDVNEENIYQSLDFVDTDGVFENGEDGITVELAKNNVLKANGVAELDKEIVVGTTTLKAGSYVFGSNLKNGSKGTIHLRVVNTATGEILANNFNSASVFSVATDTVVSVQLIVAKSVEVDNLSLQIVLCPGAASADILDFYK